MFPCMKFILCARVVELADSLASGASARKGVRVQVPPRAPCRMFITTLNIREIGVIERLLLFSFLTSFAGDVFNRYPLSGVKGDAGGQGGNLRRVQDADEVIVDVELLGTAFSYALGLVNNDFFYQLV